MTDKAEFERLLDVYGFRCERFGQDLSTHARAQVVSAFATLASAPVAGEAQLTDKDALDILAEYGEHRTEHGQVVFDKWTLMEAGEALLERCRAERAAPQASAEYDRGHADGWAAGWDQAIKQSQNVELARNAVLDEAIQALSRITTSYATFTSGNPLYRPESRPASAAIAEAIDTLLALKQPLADKDGGQQRAGDDDLLRFAWKAIRAQLDPQWECNSYHPMLYAAEERLRAALSATQAEQGERDA